MLNLKSLKGLSSWQQKQFVARKNKQTDAHRCQSSPTQDHEAQTQIKMFESLIHPKILLSSSKIQLSEPKSAHDNYFCSNFGFRFFFKHYVTAADIPRLACQVELQPVLISTTNSLNIYNLIVSHRKKMKKKY